MTRIEREHPHLRQQVRNWAADHPDGTLEQAVKDLDLWPDPGDKDARYLVWQHLPDGHTALPTLTRQST